MTYNDRLALKLGITGITKYKNGAARIMRKKADKYQVKALGCKLGDNLKAMTSVRVTHNTKKA